MSHRATRSVPSFVHDALTASQVGTWETDFGSDRTVGDATTAALFGVDPADAAEGVPLAAFARAIHPEDRGAFLGKIGRVREHGGLFVVEYRTRPAAGVVRWVLARGRYRRDEVTGHVVGRGIVIDITESKLDGRVEDRAFFVVPKGDDTPLGRLTACAIQARDILDEMGGQEGSALRRAVDALLWAVGRALAGRSRDRDS